MNLMTGLFRLGRLLPKLSWVNYAGIRLTTQLGQLCCRQTYNSAELAGSMVDGPISHSADHVYSPYLTIMPGIPVYQLCIPGPWSLC